MRLRTSRLRVGRALDHSPSTFCLSGRESKQAFQTPILGNGKEVNPMVYEIEVTIVRTSMVEAENDDKALRLALEDLRASMPETEIYEEDLKIVSRSESSA